MSHKADTHLTSCESSQDKQMSTYFKDDNLSVTNDTGASALINTVLFCKITESILPSFSLSSDYTLAW